MQIFLCVSAETLLLHSADDRLDEQALRQEFLSCLFFLVLSESPPL